MRRTISHLYPAADGAERQRSAPVVRVPTNEPVIIKRLLDIGFYNFLIPFVETEEEAVHAVASTRYPPEGIRGVSVSHRANMFGTVPDYFAQTRTSPSWCRLRASRAWITSMRSPRPRALTVFLSAQAIWPLPGTSRQCVPPGSTARYPAHFCRAKAHGKPSGILAPVEADARRYLEWGATFVAVGSDLGVFRSATQKLADSFKK
jgi:2-dehydro-3-deoxyglucarate aldolase